MEKKEYDLFANLLSNPTSSINDLIVTGISVDNTSLLDKRVYENNDEVRELFKDLYGEFDKAKFDAFYNNAKVYYNYMAQTSHDDAMLKELTFHRSNMDVSPELRRQEPDFMQLKVGNPYKITSGVITPGLSGRRTKSEDEIMLANRVLLNPTTAGENLENALWGDSPNNNFWGYFDDVLVLARYDTDGTHKDLATGLMVAHQAGELKLDDTGNFYYELLDGRDIYNKRVLNKLNVITTDGSWANLLDFFDSDDLNQKSVGGSVMKNLALVGTMFLPYVGPVIRGLSIATLMIGLIGTLGKMATLTSDNSFFSYLEGWSKSVNRLTATTEYAQSHPWCLENIINLAGDVFGLLAEQRFIFEKAPSIFKGLSMIKTDKDKAARIAELTRKKEEMLGMLLAELLRSGASLARLLHFTSALNARAASAATSEVESFIKGYNKLGEVISRGYMTAITVGDTYGEAKAAGASDMDATLLTLGYAIGEYLLLRTGLGRWNLPETRIDTYRNLAIARALFSAKESVKDAVSQATQEGKKRYISNFINAGKKAFNDVWTAASANGKRTLNATLTSAAAEGVEEMSEELLADISKGCYDIVKWLLNDGTRLNTFGYDFNRGEWNGSEIRDRYLLSLVGGAIGGGLTNLATNYRMIDDLGNIDLTQAVLLLVYMARNGGLDLFMKDVNRMELDDPNLSSNFEIINNVPVFDPGTKNNNRDLDLKRAIQHLVDIIREIVLANGAKSDNEFLDDLTLRDLRFVALLNSTTAGAYIQRYNTLLTEIAQDSLKLKALVSRDLDTNRDGTVSDSEALHNDPSENTQRTILDIKLSINDKKKELDNLVSGKRSLEFIATSLWEVTSTLSGNFVDTTLPLYAKRMFGKDILDLTEEEVRLAKEKYELFKTTAGRDKIRELALTFLEFEKLFSHVVKNHEQTYLLKSQKINDLLLLVDTFNRRFLYMGSDTILDDMLERISTVHEDIMSHNMSEFASELISIFGTDEQKRKLEDIKKRRKEAARVITPEFTKELVAQIHHPFNEELTELVYNTLFLNLHSYMQEIILGGFATKETKNLLVTLIKQIKDNVLQPKRDKRDKEIENDLTADPDTAVNQYGDLSDLLTMDMNAIEALDNTPLELNLDLFAISIGGQPIHLTLLITKVNDLFIETTDNISEFNLTEVLDEILNAIHTLLLYRAAIAAARTDNVSTGNLFGFNSTLNEVSSKVEGSEKLDLAEIDKDTADLFILDIDTNLNRLVLLARIHALNTGLKLTKLNRVSTRKDILLYKKLRFLVSILDRLDDVDESSVQNFEALLEALTQHKTLSENNEVTPENEEEFLKESLAIENAVYDFFQANQSLLTDPTKLAKLINPTNFDLHSDPKEILNEESETIDDNAFIWWLAGRAALKAQDFYFLYRLVIDLEAEHPLAPIATQEIAVYNNYANIVNGNVFNTFYLAIRKSIADDWRTKTRENRIKVLKNLGYGEKYADTRYDPYIFNFIKVPRYTNIVFTEGIPGSGKTSAVYDLTIKLLKKFNKDVLDRAILAHGANGDSAVKLKENVNLENATTFDRGGLMRYISPTWLDLVYDDTKKRYNVPNSQYLFNDENEIRTKLGINSALSTPPTLIVIDEISKFSSYDLDLIDKFAQLYGITVLVAGDLDQSSLTGSHNLNLGGISEEGYNVNIDRTNFIRSFKLGVSMRTDNMLKTINLVRTLLYLLHPEGTLNLDYTWNENGLYGDKYIAVPLNIGNIKGRDTRKDKILRLVEALSATLLDGEFIDYITDDTTSELYRALTVLSYIKPHIGGTAQGLEGRYYIVDIGYENGTNAFLKDLYTGMSRASLGSIIIAPTEDVNIVSTERKEAVIKEPISDESIRRFALKRKEMLDRVAETGNVSLIIRRSAITTPAGVLSSTTTTRRDTDAALAEAMREEKNRLLLAISLAADELEINSLITNSRYALLGADTDILAAKTLRLNLLLEEYNRKLEFKRLLLIDINNTTTLEELEGVITLAKDTYPDILLEDGIEAVYNDRKSQIETETYNREMDQYANDLISRMGLLLAKGKTKLDLTALANEAESNYPGIMARSEVKEAYNIIKLQLEKKEIITTNTFTMLPDEDPFSDDLSAITDKDLISSEEYALFILKASTPKSFPESHAEDTDNDSDPIPIIMLNHSFNTFETGVLEGENGEVIQIGDETRIEHRIDSVNGLIKIDALHGLQQPRKLHEYVKIIGTLRDIIFRTKDKSELEERLKEELGLNDIYTTFAFKSSFYLNENSATDEFGYPTEKSKGPLARSRLEKTLFNLSEDSRSKDIHYKSLVLIIGTTKDGKPENILELPLLALSSPFTLMLIKDGSSNYVFLEVFDTFDSLASQMNPNWKENQENGIDSGLNLPLLALQLIAKYGLTPRYKNLINLFKLFLRTDNFIRYIRDPLWTICKNLQARGAYITSLKGYYLLEDGLRFNDSTNQESSWIPLADFAGVTNYGDKVNPYYNPQTNVSSIFVLAERQQFGDTVLPIHPGHAFVLVSYDKSLDNNAAIIRRYILLELDPNLRKDVVLSYILPPKASLSEYLNQINDLFNRKIKKLSIGYFSTPFKLLKGLIQDEEIRGMINTKLGFLGPKVLQELDNIPFDTPVKELRRRLTETRVWGEEGSGGNRPRTIIYHLLNVLHKLSTITDIESSLTTPDPAFVLKLLEAAERLGINLYLHFRITSNNNGVSGFEGFIMPNNPKDYTFNGGPCYIHGKIDGPVFEGNMDSIVEDILDYLESPEGKPDDTASHFYKNSKLDGKRKPRRKNLEDPEVNALIDRAKLKTGLQIDANRFRGWTKELANRELATIINSSECGNIAFIINGTLHITDSSPSFLGILKNLYDNNGNVFIDFSDKVDSSGEISVQITIDGKPYLGTINVSERKLEIIELGLGSVEFSDLLQRLGITPENFSNYIEEGKQLLEMLIDTEDPDNSIDYDLSILFLSESYEEFIQKLLDLDPMDPSFDKPGSVSFRIDMLALHTLPETDLLKLIINDIIEVERNNKLDICPDVIKILF